MPERNTDPWRFCGPRIAIGALVASHLVSRPPALCICIWMWKRHACGLWLSELVAACTCLPGSVGGLCARLWPERVTLSRVCVPRVKVFNLREGEGEIQEGSNYMRLYIVLPNQSVTYRAVAAAAATLAAAIAAAIAIAAIAAASVPTSPAAIVTAI